jgi:hypothetical protein
MKLKLLSWIATGTLALVSSMPAEEAGTGHYMSGATASFIDALPDKPGLILESLFMNYSGTYGLSQGLPYGENLALNVKANANAESLLMMYSPPFHLLGGNPSFAVAVPYVWVDVKASATIGKDGGGHSIGRSDSANGIGDIEFWPLMLGWTNQDIKYDVRCAVYAPSGAYDKNQLANTGLGYWTFEPEVTFSWLSSKFGTEVSVFAGLDFNTMNTAADYQSGDIFHIDCTVAQHLPLLGGDAGVGANGFYYKQITGDSGTGARLGSFEASACGVGPVISYVHKIGKSELVFEAKWLPQISVQNTTKGDYVWIKLALLF